MSKKMLRIFSIVLFLTGLGIFLFPFINEEISKRQTNKAIEQFGKELERLKLEHMLINSDKEGDADNNNNDDQGSDTEGNAKISKLDKLFMDMESYNKKIYENGQADIKDPFSFEDEVFNLLDYGFSENIIGIITIPKMEIELALYIGADKENLTQGAAILGQTSMPTGGENTNTVIAAHRGYRGTKKFRHIDRLETGDEIIIQTPWECLMYEVSEIKIIEPTDISEVFIREGQEMITLITCHPYTKNYQRYVVYAHRKVS